MAKAGNNPAFFFALAHQGTRHRESTTESIRESVSACRRNKKLFACNRVPYALSKGFVARL